MCLFAYVYTVREEAQNKQNKTRQVAVFKKSNYIICMRTGQKYSFLAFIFPEMVLESLGRRKSNQHFSL